MLNYYIFLHKTIVTFYFYKNFYIAGRCKIILMLTTVYVKKKTSNAYSIFIYSMCLSNCWWNKATGVGNICLALWSGGLMARGMGNIMSTG